MKKLNFSKLLIWVCICIFFQIFFACAKNETMDFSSLKKISSLELKYAKLFSVDYYEGGFKLININNKRQYLVVPENKKAPENLADNITLIQLPLNNIYLSSTSVMSFFDELDCLEHIRFSCKKEEDWFLDRPKKYMQDGKIVYAGNYRTPDYDLLTSGNCQFAIQSTMIDQVPQVREKLEDLGISVLIEESAYENHPLGRTEWLKLYATLFDKEKLANEIFDEQERLVKTAFINDKTKKSVAFFYFNSKGGVSVRSKNDYVTKMVELAGGKYIFDEFNIDASSQASVIKLEPEIFYKTAKDVDFIIYNTYGRKTIYTFEELLKIDSMMEDFKAVKEKKVWVTSPNFYQGSTEFGTMILDINKILNEQDENDIKFFHKLK
ncbi:MAG: ABC transporter substrate-binding protein [Treponemataceae bacterium]